MDYLSGPFEVIGLIAYTVIAAIAIACTWLILKALTKRRRQE